MRTFLDTALRRVTFLRGASADAVAVFGRAGRVRQLGADIALFAEGDPAPPLLVVVSGAVKLFKCDTRGRELSLGVARIGDVVGAPATFDGGNCAYHAVAAGEGAAVFVVSREVFTSLLGAYPEMAGGVIRLLAMQNRRLTEMLKAQALHSVRARFASYLLSAAGDGDTFTLPETNAGIAAHLGTVREVVSRTLHGFADAGSIAVRGRTVTILDRAALTRNTAPTV